MKNSPRRFFFAAILRAAKNPIVPKKHYQNHSWACAVTVQAYLFLIQALKGRGAGRENSFKNF
ncbi:MAG: hypothetical protein IJW40_07865, partial [Clostridia bacterium]|nr:hypothetical protein [Clostridia bacterium]